VNEAETVRKEDVGALKLRDLKHVLTPLKRGRMLKDYIDIGFDTEFTSGDNSAERELLSLQFSLSQLARRNYVASTAHLYVEVSR
jgi:hypothetical protein